MENNNVPENAHIPEQQAIPVINNNADNSQRSSSYEDVYGSWPTIDMVKADFKAAFTWNEDANGNIQTVPDYRFPEMRKEVAYLICRKDPLTHTELPADSPLRIPCYPEAISRVDGKPTGFRTIRECTHIKLQSTGRLHGYIGLLHKGDAIAVPAGYKAVKAQYDKPAPFDWSTLADDADAED